MDLFYIMENSHLLWQWHFIYIARFSTTKVYQCASQQRNNKKVENKMDFKEDNRKGAGAPALQP